MRPDERLGMCDQVAPPATEQSSTETILEMRWPPVSSRAAKWMSMVSTCLHQKLPPDSSRTPAKHPSPDLRSPPLHPSPFSTSNPGHHRSDVKQEDGALAIAMAKKAWSLEFPRVRNPWNLENPSKQDVKSGSQRRNTPQKPTKIWESRLFCRLRSRTDSHD